MSMQFSTIGFINFNKEFNKELKSGAVTVSITASTKDKDGKYKTQYFNALVPAKLKVKVNEFVNGQKPLKITGVINPGQKGYVNFTVLGVEPYQNKDNSEDLPF